MHNAAKAAGQDTDLGRDRGKLCWQEPARDVLFEIGEEMSRIGPPSERDDEPEHLWCVLNRGRSYLKREREILER